MRWYEKFADSPRAEILGPAVADVEVQPAVSNEPRQSNAHLGGQVDGQAGRPGDGDDGFDASHRCLLDDLEAGAPRDDQHRRPDCVRRRRRANRSINAGGERGRAPEPTLFQGTADDLVDGVMPTYVLSDGQAPTP